MAKKQLITERHVLEAVEAGRRTLTARPDALITALARDAAQTHGLSFVPPAERGPAGPDTPSRAAAPPRTVAFGSDHGGFAYKEVLADQARALGWTVLDLGTDSEQSVDYPDFAYAVARAVATGAATFGVMIDGAGVGSAMVCNKVPGVRAAVCYNTFTAWNARAHNDAHVLTLGSRALGVEVCKRVLETFLETTFEGGRHARRVQKIMDVER